MEGKTRTNYKPRTKWWNLKDKTLAFLKDKQIKEGKWKVTENANYMLNDMVRHIKRVAKDIIRNLKETDSQIRKVGGGRNISKQQLKPKEYHVKICKIIRTKKKLRSMRERKTKQRRRLVR